MYNIFKEQFTSKTFMYVHPPSDPEMDRVEEIEMRRDIYVYLFHLPHTPRADIDLWVRRY